MLPRRSPLRFARLLPAGLMLLLASACGGGEPDPARAGAAADDSVSGPDLPAIAADAPNRFPVPVDGSWGYVDREGNPAVEPRFDSAAEFHEGRAAVEIEGRFGYVDTTGAVVVEPTFAAAGRFSEGLAAVIPEEGGPLGYVDTAGEVVLPPRFEPAGGGRVEGRHFASGRALARPAGQEGAARHGYIDRSGAWAIEPAYPFARPFAEGLAPVTDGVGGGWFFVDTAGERAFEGEWANARPFSEGLAAVDTVAAGGVGNGFRYIDRQGEIIVRPTFGSGTSAPARARSFSEGLAAVYYDGPREWRYITTSGEDATFLQVEEYRWFDEAGPFRGGLARVVVEDQDEAVYIDRRGQVVWPRPASPADAGGAPAAGGAATAADDDGAPACSDADCFEAALARCEAASYRTRSAMGARASYRILGPGDEGGCRLELTYEDNPNPSWVDRPLTFTLATSSPAGAPVTDRLRKAVRACLTGEDAGPHRCGGPLAEELGTAR